MSFSLLLLFVARSCTPSQNKYALRFALTMPLNTVLAHVNPSPAPPLLYHAVLHPPFKSEYSVCHTRALVLSGEPTRLVYSCDVIAYTKPSAPALAICDACWPATLQPVASQQFMPICVKFAASRAGRKILTNSAACAPEESMLAYEVLKSGSLRKPMWVTGTPAEA